jgi:glycosyltransferase involved in cell wall biosynthesis
MIVDILVAGFRPSYGGIPNVAFYLAQNLSNHIKVRVRTFNRLLNTKDPVFGLLYSDHLPATEEIEGVSVYRYHVTHFPLLGSFSIGLIKAVIRNDADIIHIQGFHRLSAYYPIVKFYHKKIKVFSPHALHEGMEKLQKFPLNILLKLGVIQSYFKSYDYVIASSETEKQMLLDIGCKIDKVCVIPNGISKTLFDQRSKVVKKTNGRKILCVARFARYKGQVDLLKAIKMIDKEVDFDICFVGQLADQEYFDEFLSLLKTMGLEDRVTIGTSISDADLADSYLTSDIFVLPSYQESSPISIREAMYAGLPVISTKIGSIHELVKDGVNGYLVEPGDIKQLAAKLSTLLRDEQACKRIGQKNREFSQQFTWEEIAQSTMDLYEKLTIKQ